MSSLHRIGKGIQTSDVQKALTECGLDWEVEKLPIQSKEGQYPLPEFRGIFRKDTHHNLGIVGKNYCVVQNREAAEVLQPIIENSPEQVSIQRGISFFNGDKICLFCDYGNPILIGPEPFQRQLVCSWSHNGGLALRFLFMMRRISTNSVLAVDLDGIPSSVKERHTKNVHARLCGRTYSRRIRLRKATLPIGFPERFRFQIRPCRIRKRPFAVFRPS